MVDPICLNVKLVETCNQQPRCDCELSEVPENIGHCFDSELVLGGDEKRIYISLGQFSFVRLERDAQLVIPSYDFCMPEKEYIGSSEESPCELFRRIKFPVDEFFPPNAGSFEEQHDTQYKWQK